MLGIQADDFGGSGLGRGDRKDGPRDGGRGDRRDGQRDGRQGRDGQKDSGKKENKRANLKNND